MSSERLSRVDMLMMTAFIVSQRGTCSRRAVGALIAKQGRILSTGYNGAPAGMSHCDHTSEPDVVVGTETPITGPATEIGCQRAVHAEVNAIAFAARYGIPVENSDLFTTMAPCLACAQLIINSGIIRVVCGSLHHRAAEHAGMELLQVAGIRVDTVPYPFPRPPDTIDE